MNCDNTKQPLINMDEALKVLLNQAIVTNKTKDVNLDDALGKVLALDLTSNIDVPGFDNSSMDGYAVNFQDENQLIHNFVIVGRIAAGEMGIKLQPNTCARIFTGAPIPECANAVVMQEECIISKTNNSISVARLVKPYENIRPKGNDIQKNNMILKRGRRLKPQDIALASSVGTSKLTVYEPIKVGVFFTGDELVEPGEVLKDGQIYSSNRYALVALLKNLGCDIVNLGNIKDSLSATCEALTTLQQQCDLIITTGGVSVGEEDHIKPALKKLGKLSLWRIKVKPGKPLAFGSIGNIPFLGLPGNPVSAMVTFMLFARPFIKKIQGENQAHNIDKFCVKINFNWYKKNRREFARVKLDYATQPPSAKLFPKQSSEVLSSMVWADGLLEIPENKFFSKGDILNFYPLNTLTL